MDKRCFIILSAPGLLVGTSDTKLTDLKASNWEDNDKTEFRL
jgi:hypothetical protein